MKRGIWMGILLLWGCALFAQTELTGSSEFRRDWFLQVQAGVGSTLGEISFGDLLSPSAALSLGYQFTPVWGLRGGFSGWQAKGGWVAPQKDYKYNYGQLNVDAIYDLCNSLNGFNPRRFFNPYLFLGIGGNYAFGNDGARELHRAGYPLQYIWEDSRFFLAGRGGVGFNFRLGDGVAFNLEGNANVLSDHFNSKKAGNADWHFNILAGFTFRLGKGYTKQAKGTAREIVPVVPVIPEPKQTEEPEPPETAQVPVEIEKPELIRENIFFALNSSEIRSCEEPKIKTLLAFLKKYKEVKVHLTGYADRDTGNMRVNSKLSQRRAEQVAAALVEAGIEQERIMVNYKGDTEQPFSTPEKNRVTICVTYE